MRRSGYNSFSIKIWYFLGFVLSLIVPLHHFGCFILLESGFFSYKPHVPIGILANSLPVFGTFSCLSNVFSISDSFDFWCAPIMGKFVLYFQHFNISAGLLLIPGMSVVLNMSIASHAWSVFFIIECIIVWTIHFNTANRLIFVGTRFFDDYVQFGVKIIELFSPEIQSNVT